MRKVTSGFAQSHLAFRRFALQISVAMLACATFLTGWTRAQNKGQRTDPGEGCLMYRSPVSGFYENIPLLHTDAALDVRGLVASATVTQQYANSGSAPLEAVYVFPLPHD